MMKLRVRNRRRRRMHVFLPDPRPPVAHRRPDGWTHLDEVVEEFIADVENDYRYEDLSLVYEEEGVRRFRLDEKYDGGYFNVKVTGDTLSLLKERKRAARRLLGGYDVYDIHKGWKDGPYYGMGTILWRARYTKAYFHRDFVENTSVIEKHLYQDIECSLENHTGMVAHGGKAKHTTSIGVVLRGYLVEWRDKYGYSDMDHLIRTILVLGERVYNDYLEDLGRIVERELKAIYGTGERGYRKHVTRDAIFFLGKFYGL